MKVIASISSSHSDVESYLTTIVPSYTSQRDTVVGDYDSGEIITLLKESLESVKALRAHISKHNNAYMTFYEKKMVFGEYRWSLTGQPFTRYAHELVVDSAKPAELVVVAKKTYNTLGEYMTTLLTAINKFVAEVNKPEAESQYGLEICIPIIPKAHREELASGTISTMLSRDDIWGGETRKRYNIRTVTIRASQQEKCNICNTYIRKGVSREDHEWSSGCYQGKLALDLANTGYRVTGDEQLKKLVYAGKIPGTVRYSGWPEVYVDERYIHLADIYDNMSKGADMDINKSTFILTSTEDKQDDKTENIQEAAGTSD